MIYPIRPVTRLSTHNNKSLQPSFQDRVIIISRGNEGYKARVNGDTFESSQPKYDDSTFKAEVRAAYDVLRQYFPFLDPVGTYKTLKEAITDNNVNSV